LNESKTVSSEKTKSLRASESHRLLIGSGRYIHIEKQFASTEEMRDWLMINTLLSKESIEELFSAREIEFDEGGKPEWYKYLPPVKQ
jgi:hypothetical protein